MNHKLVPIVFTIIMLIVPTINAQFITITTPNGGESYSNSTSYGIIWTDDIPAYVKIDLYKGGEYYYTVEESTQSDGYYIWIPNVMESDTDYKIKITSLDDSTVYDFSDGDFSITKSELTVTTPNGGENYSNSTNYGIIWTDNLLSFIRIDLYKGGEFYYTVADSTQSDGFHLWTPNVAESGTDYKIKITSLASSNDFDFSDNDFSITKSEITISTPNGGEVLSAGAEQSVIWSDNLLVPVKIELFKGGEFHSTIIDTTPSNGFFLWTISDTISGANNYKVKISSVTSSNDFDFSNNNFSILNTTGIDDIIDQLPDNYTLMQNYPNPFNPKTNIVFGLPVSSFVSIDLFNVIGEQVDVIFKGYEQAGFHTIEYDASILNSGIYFYRINAEDFSETRKMILLK